VRHAAFDDEHLGDAGEGAHRRPRHRQPALVVLHHHLAAAEEARTEPVVGVRDLAFEGERARRRIGRGTDARDAPEERLARIRVDGYPQRLPDLERRDVVLGYVAPELERVVLDEPEHHHAGTHVVADARQPGGHGAGEGRANRRALDLDAEPIAPRLGHFLLRAHALVFLHRDHAVVAKRLGPDLIGVGLLERRVRLAQLRFEHVAAHARQHLARRHPVAQIGLDADELSFRLARELRFLGRGERAHDRDQALHRPLRRGDDGDGHRFGRRGRGRGGRDLAVGPAGREQQHEKQRGLHADLAMPWR
jgi:hypothetical protein